MDRMFDEGEKAIDRITNRPCEVCEYDNGFYTVFIEGVGYANRGESELSKAKQGD